MELPDFLAIVGDLVFCGSSAANWTTFDTLATPLYDARCRSSALGNYDYGIVRNALRHFFTRFPHLERCHWFSRTYGPLGLIFLDSNAGWLPVAQWRKQVCWYEQEIQRFEQREDIRGVLVLLHHPPYTNSTLVLDDLAVQRVLCRPLCRSVNHGDDFWTWACATSASPAPRRHSGHWGGGARLRSTRTGGVATSTMASMGHPPRLSLSSSSPLSTRLEIEMRRSPAQRHGGLRRWTTSLYPGRQAPSKRRL